MEYNSRGPSQGWNEWGRREKRLKRGRSQRKTGNPEKRSRHVRDRVCDGVQNIEFVTGRKWGARGAGRRAAERGIRFSFDTELHFRSFEFFDVRVGAKN